MTKEPQTLAGILLDESITYTLVELCEICAVDEGKIQEMVEYGIVEPKGDSPQQWVFTYLSLVRSKKALRLQQDLAINWQGISMVLDLLEEVNELRQWVEILKKE